MALTLQQLLDEPALGLELIAGARGLDRPRPLRWAHVSEIPDPTPWLEGGELVLTTGMGVKDDPALQRRLVAGLSASGCAGIGFGVGVLMPDVPAALADAAEREALPLLAVPYEVPFIAIARHVAHHTSDAHVATLRTAVDLHRRVLAAVVADAGLDGTLAVVSRALPQLSWLVLDPYGQALASRDPTGALDDLDRRSLWEALPRGRERFSFPHSGHVVSGGPVRVGDRVEATLVVVGSHHPLEHEALLIEQGLTGVSLELARGRSIREARRQHVAELLEDVTGARVSDQALAHRVRRLGLDPSAPYQVLCLRGSLPDQLADLAEDVLGGVGGGVGGGVLSGVVGLHGSAVLCIVQPPGADHAERLAAACAQRPGTAACIGRSAPKSALAGLGAAIREATAAARATGHGPGAVTDVADLGLAGLLAALGDDAGAAMFVERVLGPVLAHDGREGTALADTLRAYLRHGCRPGPAAAEMRVHRHTLGHRLERVRELTGRDPRDGAYLIEYGLALELHGAGSAQP